jgi:hypothetical protein
MSKAGDYVLVRSREQGVMCGEYVWHSGREVHLRNARQIWSWSGQRMTLVDVSVVPSGEMKISRASAGDVVMLEACGIIVPSSEVAEWLKNLPAS